MDKLLVAARLRAACFLSSTVKSLTASLCISHQCWVSLLAAVSTQVPELYKEYPNLKLTIHCGVGREGQLKLETLARNTSYRHKDNDQTFPSDNVSCFVGLANSAMTVWL
jgi:hypothetical protein